MVTKGAESRGMGTIDEGSTGGLSPREKGEVIHNRRVTAQIKSVAKMAELSGIHRDTIKKAEDGTASDATYERLMAWLDTYTGEPADDPPRVVTFEARGVFGVAQVSVAGPVENADELAQQFADLITKLAREAGGS